MNKIDIDKPKFSIVTVVYNGEKHLEETIQSVISQDYADYEYIVIDGSSTDNTLKIIEKYKNKIDYFISEPDKGIYDAMNKGYRAAKGAYVYYLNADDCFFNNNTLYFIAKVIEKSATSYDVLSGGVIVDYGEYSTYSKQKLSTALLKKAKMPPHQGIFIKRDIMKLVEGFNTIYKSSGDFELLIRVNKLLSNIRYLEFTIAVMKAGGTSSNKRISYKETAKILSDHFGFFPYIYYIIKKLFIEQGIRKLLQAIFPEKLIIYMRKNYLGANSSKIQQS